MNTYRYECEVLEVREGGVCEHYCCECDVLEIGEGEGGE